MFRNLVRSLLTKGTVAAINFLLLLLSARYLGVSSRGEISIFLLNLSLIQIVNEVYTGYSLVHFIPKYDNKRLFAYGVIFTLIFCSLGNLVIFAAHKEVAGYEWAAYLIALLVLFNSFNCVLILGHERVGFYNFLSWLQPLLLLIGLVVAVFVAHDYTFRAYVYPLFISFAVANIFSWALVIRLLPGERKKTDFRPGPVLVNGLLSQLGILMYVFCSRYSYYLLPGREQVGLYAAASTLTESVFIIMNGIAPVLLSRVANQGPAARRPELALGLAKLSLLVSGLLLCLILLLPEELYVFVMGKGFKGIQHLMRLYAPGVLLMSASAIISGYFSAIGKPGVILFCNSLGFVFSLFFAPVLVKHFQAAGAAYAADLAYLLISAAACICFLRIAKFSPKRLLSVATDYRQLRELVAD